MYRRSPLRSTLRIVCSTGLPTCLPIYSTGVLFGMMPCLTDWLGSAGSFYLKPPTGNLGTRTAIRTTVRPQLAHGRDSQSRPNLSYRRLEVLAKFRPLAARGSAQLLNLVSHRDPASRFSSPPQKSAAAAAAGRAQLQSTNLCFGAPC